MYLKSKIQKGIVSNLISVYFLNLGSWFSLILSYALQIFIMRLHHSSNEKCITLLMRNEMVVFNILACLPDLLSKLLFKQLCIYFLWRVLSVGITFFTSISQPPYLNNHYYGLNGCVLYQFRDIYSIFPIYDKAVHFWLCSSLFLALSKAWISDEAIPSISSIIYLYAFD